MSEWLPALARILGARPPMHVPRWVGRLAVGEVGATFMTDIRGASNAKAKRELGWEPRHPRGGVGFAAARGVPDGAGPAGTPAAEGVGFEPTVGCPTHAFQACRFGRSRIPPGRRLPDAAGGAGRWLPGPDRLSCPAPVVAGGGRVLCNRSP